MATQNGSLAYRVVVRGIKPARSLDEVVDALSRLLKMRPAMLRLALDGRKMVFTRTTDVQRAAAYRRTLEMMGCACSLEAERPVPPAADDQAFTVNFATAAIQPAPGRQFQFAQAPTRRKILVNYLRANRISLAIAAVLLFYLVYKFVPRLG